MASSRPPAILKAGSVMPNTLKIKLPMAANAVRTMKQVPGRLPSHADTFGGTVHLGRHQESGDRAKGSTMKKTELIVTRENSRTALSSAFM
jgi:hypothetical protein